MAPRGRARYTGRAVARGVPYGRGRNSRVTEEGSTRRSAGQRHTGCGSPYCLLFAPGGVATPHPHGAGAAARRSGRLVAGALAGEGPTAVRELCWLLTREAALTGMDAPRGAPPAVIGADLIGANLVRADLAGANLLVAVLTRAYLGGASLRGAELRGASMWAA